MFATRSEEGKKFYLLIEQKLKALFDCSIFVYKDKFSSQNLLEACLNSGIVIFDATREYNQDESNLDTVTLSVVHLEKVLIVSRNYLPTNLIGIRNMLALNDCNHGAPAYPSQNVKFNKNSVNDVIDWLISQIKDILEESNRDLLISADNNIEININPDNALFYMAITNYLLIKKSDRATQNELMMTLFQINVLILQANLLSDEKVSVRERFEMTMQATNAVFERFISELEVDCKVGDIAINSEKYVSFYEKCLNIYGDISPDCSDFREKIVSFFLSDSLVDMLKKHNIFFRIVKVSRVSDFFSGSDIDKKVFELLKETGSVYGLDIKRLYLNESDLRNIVCKGLSYPLLSDIFNSISSFDHQDHNKIKSFSAILFEMYRQSLSFYTDKIKSKYKGFVSYRTCSFDDAQNIAKNKSYLIVHPNEFALKNELFSLRRRFALMRAIYLPLIRLDKLSVNVTDDYHLSWWTLFELISFINKDEYSLHKIEPKKIPGISSYSDLMLSLNEKYILQRFLLYSNNMILQNENTQLLMTLGTIFPGVKSVNLLSMRFDLYIMQCIHSPFDNELIYSDLRSFLLLEKPHHVFIEKNTLPKDGVLPCPGFHTEGCPKHLYAGQFNNKNACVFFLVRNEYPRYMLEYDVKNILVEEQVYTFQVISK